MGRGEYQITNQPTKNKVIEQISQLDLSKRWLVKILDWTGQRTAAQNRLLWRWNTEIGKHFGLEKEDCHELLKEKFLCNIFVRDDPGYAKMAAAIRAVKKMDRENYGILKAEVVRLTSTTNCSPVQMAEYLTSIKRWALHNGVIITIPPDDEYEWLTHVSKKKTDKIER